MGISPTLLGILASGVVAMPSFVTVDFGATILDSAVSGAPTVIPGIKVLPATTKVGNEFRYQLLITNGAFTEQYDFRWDPVAQTGLVGAGIFQTSNPAPTSCWINWPTKPASPYYGLWAGGYSSSGVINGSTWPASVLVSSTVGANGIVWTTRLPTSGSLAEGLGVGAAGDPNGTKMAVSGSGSNANALWVSNDGGLTWAQRNPSPRADAIFFANGVFFILNFLGLFYSTDLVTFTQCSGYTWDSAFMVEYIGGQFVTLGAANRAKQTSPTGAVWTYAGSDITTVSNTIYTVRIPSGIVMLEGNNGSGVKAHTSTDGLNWTMNVSTVGTTTFQLQGASYGNGRIIAVGYDSAIASNTMHYSDDGGVTWSARIVIPTVAYTDQKKVLYKNGVWIIGSKDDAIRSTDGGLTWSTGVAGMNGAVWSRGALSQSNFVLLSPTNTLTNALKSSPA